MEQMLADNPCDCKLIAYECEDKLGLKAALQKEQALKELLLDHRPGGRYFRDGITAGPDSWGIGSKFRQAHITCRNHCIGSCGRNIL